ncbi:MAG: hypothetical protein M5T61_00810 [Acidimicrobiia bacterium]|nr:hypothetical protein [Acidimicrobiia bacterium]
MPVTPLPTAPPPTVPFTFLAAGGVGLVGFGIALALGANHAVEDPRLPGVVAAVHVGLLTFASTAVLGAVHQFGPVVGVRALRSVVAARVTAALWVLGAWMLPNGFAHGPGGRSRQAARSSSPRSCSPLGTSRPLSSRTRPRSGGGGAALLDDPAGGYGVVRNRLAFDREAGWFPLLTHRVLATRTWVSSAGSGSPTWPSPRSSGRCSCSRTGRGHAAVRGP